MRHNYINNSGYSAFIKALLLILLALAVAGFAGCDKSSLIPPKEKEIWVDDLTYDLPAGWVWKGNAGEHHSSAFYGEIAPPTDSNDDDQPSPVRDLIMVGASPGTEEDAKKAMMELYDSYLKPCEYLKNKNIISANGDMRCTYEVEGVTFHLEYTKVTIAGLNVYTTMVDVAQGNPAWSSIFAFVKEGRVVVFGVSSRIEDNIDVLENLITTLRFNKVLKTK